MRVRKVLWVLTMLMAVTLLGVTAFAHERDEHDKDISRVLFGVDDYKKSHPELADTIQALEDATYLAVDQFNGKGQDALDFLRRNRNIPELPSSIEAFDFSSNYSHRSLTHRGWDFPYPEKAHWEMRKTIMMNTVEHELFIDTDTPLSWFPWLSEIVYGRNGSIQQQESFCILLYCTHIIGDHIEAEKYQDLAYISPLVRPNDRDNPGIIPDLISCLDILIEDQKSSFSYTGLAAELNVLRDKSHDLISSPGGINSEEKFIEYHKCAIALMETLEMYIPQLLRYEDFFRKRFYK